MSNWVATRKRARKGIRRGAKQARQYVDQLREDTAPQREFLRREARRQAPRLLALALSTALEMFRNSRRAPRSGTRRRWFWKLLVLTGLVLAVREIARSKD
jgi:hypothetical protein